MAAKKVTKVTVEVDMDVLKRLADASDALSEMANALVTGADDPKVRAQLTKKRGATKRAK